MAQPPFWNVSFCFDQYGPNTKAHDVVERESGVPKVGTRFCWEWAVPDRDAERRPKTLRPKRGQKKLFCYHT